MYKKIKGPPLDKDFARLMNFLSSNESSEDDIFLANLWLEKFNLYRDTNPPRDDTNKRISKPLKRFVPTEDVASPPAIVKSTRAPALKATIPKVVDLTTTGGPTTSSSGNVVTKDKPPLIAPAINEKVLANWKSRFEILLKQAYAVEEGDQNTHREAETSKKPKKG